MSLAAGEPAIDCFPTAAFQRAVDHVLKHDARAAWSHGPTEGQPALRDAIGERFRVPPESVLVLAGAQQGLDLLARCLIDPGDAVIIDRPGYLGAIQSFRAAGAKLIGWDVARADIDELEDLLVRYRPKLIYTNPTFQNPTGHDAADPDAVASCSSWRSGIASRSWRTRPIGSCTSTRSRRRRCATSTRRTSSST